jgi:hypothetical protein
VSGLGRAGRNLPELRQLQVMDITQRAVVVTGRAEIGWDKP